MEEGDIAAGDALELLERGREDLSIDGLNRLMFRDLGNEERVMALQDEESLSTEWRTSLLRRFKRSQGDPA